MSQNTEIINDVSDVEKLFLLEGLVFHYQLKLN